MFLEKQKMAANKLKLKAHHLHYPFPLQENFTVVQKIINLMFR